MEIIIKGIKGGNVRRGVREIAADYHGSIQPKKTAKKQRYYIRWRREREH